MRFLLMLAGLLLALAPQAAFAATVFSTPKALLDYAYAPYASGNFKDDNDVLYTHELNHMLTAAEQATGEDEVGPIDFDVFTNAQDFQLSDLKIGEPEPEAGGVKVGVTFKNFGDAQSLLFHLVEEGGGWKIADIECQTPGEEWKLTTLLTTPPDNGSDTSGAGAATGSGGD